jgi:hypothetical protein
MGQNDSGQPARPTPICLQHRLIDERTYMIDPVLAFREKQEP